MKSLIVLAIPIALLIIYKIAQSLTPTKPVEYTLITTLIGLVIYLGKMIFTLKVEEGSFKSRINSLEKENSNLKSNSDKEIDNFKKENIALQEQISKYTHNEKFLSNYPPDPKIAMRREKTTNRPVCNLCIQLGKPIVSYLEEHSDSFYCRSCQKSFRK